MLQHLEGQGIGIIKHMKGWELMGKVIEFKKNTNEKIDYSIKVSEKNEPYVDVQYAEHRSAWLIWIESPTYEQVDALRNQGLQLLKQRIVIG